MAEYVGLNVSKEEPAFCVKDASGQVLARGKVPTEPAAVLKGLKWQCRCAQRVVREAGTTGAP